MKWTRMCFVAVFAMGLTVMVASCNGGNKQADSSEQKKEGKANVVEAGKYINDKYGFELQFPAGYFDIVIDSLTDEGAVLESVDLLVAKIDVHAGNLDGRFTELDDINKAFEADVAYKGVTGKRSVSYKMFDVNNYTIVGYEGKTIFHQKTTFTKGLLVTVLYTYDSVDLRDTYSAMANSILKSLK